MVDSEYSVLKGELSVIFAHPWHIKGIQCIIIMTDTGLLIFVTAINSPSDECLMDFQVTK